MSISEKELLERNPKEKLVKSAVDRFKHTYDCREAGFILEDGSMLDFSGKRKGGTPRTRSMDHREICDAFDTGDKGIEGGECLDSFERIANAIRFGTYGSWDRGHDMIVQMNTYQHPTAKQLKKIESCCKLFKVKEIAYDVFAENGDRLVSDYVKGTCKIMVENIARALKTAKESDRHG